MEIPIHYGFDVISLAIPETNIADVLMPSRQGVGHCEQEILASLDKLIYSDDFVDSIVNQHVGILLPDGTRDMPIEKLLPLFGRIFERTARTTFFICTGTHNPDTVENARIIDTIKVHSLSTPGHRFDIVIHDCERAEYVAIGKSHRGTEIFYNAQLDQCDLFCVLSDVKHHYFAGYSNPIKNFVPGLCAFKTIEQNHSMTLDNNSRAGLHPWHGDPARRNNPLACDQLEAFDKILGNRPVWALTTITTQNEILWADFGPAKDVTTRAFDIADLWNMRKVEPVKKMIVSPGGMPNDYDLYIAQRALELTGPAIRDGGEILFISACPNGIGPQRSMEHFYNRLTRPLTEILDYDLNQYQLFSHKPYRFAQLISRLNRLWLYSQIEDPCIEAIHMQPVSQPQTIVDGWLKNNPEEKILVVDGANKLVLVT